MTEMETASVDDDKNVRVSLTRACGTAHLGRRKGPATPTRLLVFGWCYNTLLAPVKGLGQVSSGNVPGQIGRGEHGLVGTAGLGATHFVLELRRREVRKLRYQCCRVELSPSSLCARFCVEYIMSAFTIY